MKSCNVARMEQRVILDSRISLRCIQATMLITIE